MGKKQKLRNVDRNSKREQERVTLSLRREENFQVPVNVDLSPDSGRVLSGYKLQQSNNSHGIQIFPNQIKFNIISQLIKAMDKNDSNFNEKFQRLKKACNDQAQWMKDPRAGMQI